MGEGPPLTPGCRSWAIFPDETVEEMFATPAGRPGFRCSASSFLPAGECLVLQDAHRMMATVE